MSSSSHQAEDHANRRLAGVLRVGLKRAYEKAEERDGTRVLVDRLWPRGVSKDRARLDAWMKELAPSDELRTCFGHRTDRWSSFQERYQDELRTPLRQLLLAQLESVADRSPLTLVYGARETSENEAAVISDYLRGKHPKSARHWNDGVGVLTAIGVVAAAHSSAQATTSTLSLFVTPHLTDRALVTALQALESRGTVRGSSRGWQLTPRGIKQVRGLSEAADNPQITKRRSDA